MSSLWVLSILDAHDWSMAELARRCGASGESVLCWVKGRSRPLLENLLNVATAHISALRERSPMVARRTQSARLSRNVTLASRPVTRGHAESRPVQHEAA
jgi:transcriptional regulator with XRE-family HTH domain